MQCSARGSPGRLLFAHVAQDGEHLQYVGGILFEHHRWRTTPPLAEIIDKLNPLRLKRHGYELSVLVVSSSDMLGTDDAGGDKGSGLFTPANQALMRSH